ncbi:MAG: fructose-bisphosphate aldolase class I [Dehalococcoidia bacterium]|nr:fructose-bisphosphate aldolase class I [Dehalococcoidia bacterium]
MDKNELKKIANLMVSPKKGILAADEITGTIQKRFDSIGVVSNEINRRDWRQLLFQTDTFSDYISGVILFDETLRQKTTEGESIVDLLTKQGIIPGIKVDKSTHPLALFESEVITEGLDGLRSRLEEYLELGAKFTKWRSVINIGNNLPSDFAIDINSYHLALYAALCQEVGLVPIVEPEVLMDGNHSIEECADVTLKTLNKVFMYLKQSNVYLEGIILKPNMVVSGKECNKRANSELVAKKTIEVLKESVPSEVPGIAFLSGGQADQESIDNLNAINIEAKKENAPWELTYSYGRGLQSSPLQIWRGDTKNIKKAQKEFEKRGLAASLAREGLYK